jgi:hypothetical protein
MKCYLKSHVFVWQTSLVLTSYRTTSVVAVSSRLQHRQQPPTHLMGQFNGKFLFQHNQRLGYANSLTTTALGAKPKSGSVVESYQTVSVKCSKCSQRLFRYKKKNGTKSNLVKCYVERIVEDSAGVLALQESSGVSPEEFSWQCPACQTQFARSAQIHGRPALKIVGGKVRMTKK